MKLKANCYEAVSQLRSTRPEIFRFSDIFFTTSIARIPNTILIHIPFKVKQDTRVEKAFKFLNPFIHVRHVG